MTDTRERIEALIERIADARRQTAANGRVDLAGMEDQVEAVCLTVRQPGHQADVQMRERLAHLLAELNALEEDLIQRRDMLVGNTAPAVAPQAAAAAYGKTKR